MSAKGTNARIRWRKAALPRVAELIGDVTPWTTYTGNKLQPTQKPLRILMLLGSAFAASGDVGARLLDAFCAPVPRCSPLYFSRGMGHPKFVVGTLCLFLAVHGFADPPDIKWGSH